MSAEGEFTGEGELKAAGEPDPGESLGSASRSMMPRPSLGVLLRAGLRALGRFPGLVLIMYLVQVALSAGAALVMMLLLLDVFGGRPLFDRAMDGDLAALMSCFRAEPDLLPSLLGIGIAAVLIYGVVSWFLTAGLVAVLLDAPSRRREVVRWFGAAGASNFFPFLRLSVWSALPYALVLVAAGFGIGLTEERRANALGANDMAVALALALGPAFLLRWPVAAAIDYARIDLVRHPGMSSLRALVRGLRTVARHPLALSHTLLHGAAFIGVWALYVWVSGSDATSGLVALVALRQLAGLVRFAAHVAVIAGQVELACAAMMTPLGPRR
ncbi:MAG TPA: hypothetical protein VEL05_10220 [Candidatus Acidoferrum sp.]|nr:hypothetical protein [Candidatus Acidoferrum sp.]